MKQLSILLFSILLISFSSCTKDDDDNPNPTENITTTNEEEEVDDNVNCECGKLLNTGFSLPEDLDESVFLENLCTGYTEHFHGIRSEDIYRNKNIGDTICIDDAALNPGQRFNNVDTLNFEISNNNGNCECGMLLNTGFFVSDGVYESVFLKNICNGDVQFFDAIVDEYIYRTKNIGDIICLDDPTLKPGQRFN